VKFGIMNLFPVADGASDHQVLRDTLDEIQLADELGFDSVWLAEHHFSKYGILGSPINFGMAIAERTSRITIGTAVLVLPLHHPLRLAEDIAALDVLSGGRVTIGVGRGYQPSEFAGMGVPLAESKERYQETLEILRLALERDDRALVEAAAARLVSGITTLLEVEAVDVRVLAVRPELRSAELHGLYTRDDQRRPRIRVWMRTLRYKRVVAFRTFLRTLLHELCHHLDYTLFGLADSFHTQGFFSRESALFKQLVPGGVPPRLIP